MCTLTWTHRVDGAHRGYRLFFNRDELRSRGPEVAPSFEQQRGVSYVAPSDSDAGGTWIAVNEFGLTVCLLNGYVESRGPARGHWTSRGQLVRSLADLPTITAAWNRLSPAALVEYPPCVVVIVPPEGRGLVARWDGLDVVLDGQGERQLPVTSSSYEQNGVQAARRETYRTMVAEPGGDAPPDAESLRAFQNYVTPEGPTAYTPTMARPDAATRSQCIVEVDETEVRFLHVPGAPHETRASAPTVLARSPLTRGERSRP